MCWEEQLFQKGHPRKWLISYVIFWHTPWHTVSGKTWCCIWLQHTLWMEEKVSLLCKFALRSDSDLNQLSLKPGIVFIWFPEDSSNKLSQVGEWYFAWWSVCHDFDLMLMKTLSMWKIKGLWSWSPIVPKKSEPQPYFFHSYHPAPGDTHITALMEPSLMV